ncbi:MAG: HAMP domain-containing histidine kinase [Deltaproteobacteria bacterium]|nr:HAMP domain-containing histidine kinase [Deltaproteobacteria bacterium]
MPQKIFSDLRSFIAEVESPGTRPKLWFGIWTGFAIAIGFGVLVVATAAFELTPWRWEYLFLIAIKLVTNTFALLGLVRSQRVIATQALNSIADVVLLTAAIYYTGGPYSPLLPTYVIIITVLSLLTNRGITVMMASLIVVLFSTMLVLMATGVLPPTVVPGSPGAVPTVGYTITAIALCALVVGVPAWFAAATLRQLRLKEHALEERTALLIRTATQRSQFVASMTHELRTPIHGVQGLSDVIAAGVYGPVTDKQRDACASIKRSAQSLLGLVDDLLNLTRAEAGKIEARPSAVDLPALVEHVTSSVSWILGTKKLTLAVDLEPDLPVVSSDERWLAHIFVNLLANAVKFTPESGRVTIQARRRGDDAVAFDIIDTGIGIAPKDQAAIFEPFRQVERGSGDEKEYGGVGLGLALVARLTDLLGAKVEVESQVNKGSTFRVIVPIRWRGRGSTQMMRAVRPPSIIGDE